MGEHAQNSHMVRQWDALYMRLKRTAVMLPGRHQAGYVSTRCEAGEIVDGLGIELRQVKVRHYCKAQRTW